MSFVSTPLALSQVLPSPPPPDAFLALSAWKTGPGPGRNRSWQLTSWGEDAVRLSVSWVFGDGQLGSIDRYAPSVSLRAGPTASVGYLAAAVLKSFAEWQTAYQATRPEAILPEAVEQLAEFTLNCFENPPDPPTT